MNTSIVHHSLIHHTTWNIIHDIHIGLGFKIKFVFVHTMIFSPHDTISVVGSRNSNLDTIRIMSVIYYVQTQTLHCESQDGVVIIV